MRQDRRTFLKRSGAALSAAAVSGCLPNSAERQESSAAPLHAEVLRAVAQVVLPSDLEDASREEAVQAFEQWVSEYEPVAELNHGYGTSEIRYGPPDPVPAWQAQLEALEIEASRRTGSSFAELDIPRRRDLITRQGLDGGSGLPNPLRARHVAVALMAHWFGSSEAVDRCYGRRIAERSCRGIDTAPSEPEAV